jgi:hypothetical protein
MINFGQKFNFTAEFSSQVCKVFLHNVFIITNSRVIRKNGNHHEGYYCLPSLLVLWQPPGRHLVRPCIQFQSLLLLSEVMAKNYVWLWQPDSNWDELILIYWVLETERI